MPKIVDFSCPRIPPTSEDEGAWSEVREYLRYQFPNPQRIGCPGDKLLSRLAQGGLELNEAEAWLDHFSRCSACFCDFEIMQLQVKKRRRLFSGVSVAAVICLALTSGLLLTYRHKEISKKDATSATVQPSQRLEISLHYEDKITNRDTANEPEANLQKLPRRALSLSVYLPPGSEVGSYDLTFLGTLDGPSLITCAGTVTIENGMPVLRATADISSLPTGTYMLGLRPPSGHRRYFRVGIS